MNRAPKETAVTSARRYVKLADVAALRGKRSHNKISPYPAIREQNIRERRRGRREGGRRRDRGEGGNCAPYDGDLPVRETRFGVREISRRYPGFPAACISVAVPQKLRILRGESEVGRDAEAEPGEL